MQTLNRSERRQVIRRQQSGGRISFLYQRKNGLLASCNPVIPGAHQFRIEFQSTFLQRALESFQPHSRCAQPFDTADVPESFMAELPQVLDSLKIPVLEIDSHIAAAGLYRPPIHRDQNPRPVGWYSHS